MGSILDTVSKDTEDTALSGILSVSWIHFQAILLMVSVSKYLKDTEDTTLMYLYLRYISKVSSPTLAKALENNIPRTSSQVFCSSTYMDNLS